jgi:hypothetical protein
VRLSQRRIGLWLNAAGVAERVSESAGLPTEPFVDVLDSDERGLWIKTNRADGAHLVLVRWKYVALVDVMLGGVKTKGLP